MDMIPEPEDLSHISARVQANAMIATRALSIYHGTKYHEIDDQKLYQRPEYHGSP